MKISKIGNRLRRIFGIGALLYSTIANGATIRQRVYQAHDGTSTLGMPVSCWVNDGSSGIQDTNVGTVYPSWGVDTGNFDPTPTAGDTIKSRDSLQVGPKIYTGHMRRITPGGNVTLAPGFLSDPDKQEAHTLGIWKVKDPNGIGNIKAEGSLDKNPDQKIPFFNFVRNADTLDLTDIYGQVYLNTQKQDSIWNQSDNATIRLYATRNDTTWESDTTFPIDTTKYGSATMLDSLVFLPERFSVFKDISLENIVLADSADSGAVVTPKVVVKNNGTINQNPYVKCKIGEFYTDSTQKEIAPGIDTVTFSPCTLSTVGNFDVKYNSNLAGDVNPANDSLEKTIEVTSIPDTTGPAVSNVTALADQDSTGPWYVGADFSDPSGISGASIIYNYNSVVDSADADSSSSGRWHFTLPATLNDTTEIEYRVKAADSSPAQNKSYSGWQGFTSRKPVAPDTTGPSIVGTAINDTSFTGPYNAPAWITDVSGIKNAQIKYRFNDGAVDSAGPDSVKIDTSYFTIPQANVNDTVRFMYEATDSLENKSATEWQSFYVKGVGAPESTPGIREKFKAWYSKNKLNVKGVEKGKEIKAYNIAGQKAGEWTSDATGAYGFNVPNGIYFVKPDGEKKTEKVTVLK